MAIKEVYVYGQYRHMEDRITRAHAEVEDIEEYDAIIDVVFSDGTLLTIPKDQVRGILYD